MNRLMSLVRMPLGNWLLMGFCCAAAIAVKIFWEPSAHQPQAINYVKGAYISGTACMWAGTLLTSIFQVTGYYTDPEDKEVNHPLVYLLPAILFSTFWLMFSQK